MFQSKTFISSTRFNSPFLQYLPFNRCTISLVLWNLVLALHCSLFVYVCQCVCMEVFNSISPNSLPYYSHIAFVHVSPNFHSITFSVVRRDCLLPYSTAEKLVASNPPCIYHYIFPHAFFQGNSYPGELYLPY